MSTPPTRSLQWYKDAILNGIRFQVKYAKSNMWEQYKAYYRHEFPVGILPVNLVYSILRSLVPQVYFRNPEAIITPTRPGIEYELHARLIEDTDNWLLRETKTKYQIKKMIDDTFLCGISTGFFGYDSQYGFNPAKTIGGTGQASLTQFNKKGDRIEYHSNLNPGMPWFLRAKPEDTIYPWGTESADTSEWVALRVFRPLADVKDDTKYTNKDKLTGSFTQRRTLPEGSARGPQDVDGVLRDYEWVELFEIHDLKTKKVKVLTMDHDKFLRDDEDAMQIEGLPIETTVFNPDPDWIYGIPDTRIIEPQLLELNEIRTQAMKHRRVDLMKFLYKKGAISKEAMQNMLSEDVQAGVEVDADISIREAVLPLQPGASAILADLERFGDVIRGDVREIVGFSRTSTGEYQGKTHISAKETEVVQWANQIRIDERRDIIADLLERIIRRHNQTVFTYWTQPMVRSIMGPDGARYWIKFTPSEIRGEYNERVDPSNAIPTDKRIKRQEAIEMAQAWANMNMGLVKSGVPAPAELQRYFFSQFDGIDIDKVLAQIGNSAPAAPGPGNNPEQPLPPGPAAAQMGRNTGRIM